MSPFVPSVALAFACVGLVHIAPATVITDPSFFDAIPHTVLDFERDGEGRALDLGPGIRAMPAAEYAACGVELSRPLAWINDDRPDFAEALRIAGSPGLALAGDGAFFDLVFTQPTRAFAAWTICDSTAPTRPAFLVLDADDNLLGAASISESAVDGNIGAAMYAFVGFASAWPIAKVRVVGGPAQFDNLTISPVPAPGGAALLAIASMLPRRARRRRHV